MSNFGVNVFSKQAGFHDLGPIPLNAGDLHGWPLIKDFISIVNFHVGNLCPIRVSTFSRNRRGFVKMLTTELNINFQLENQRKKENPLRLATPTCPLNSMELFPGHEISPISRKR